MNIFLTFSYSPFLPQPFTNSTVLKVLNKLKRLANPRLLDSETPRELMLTDKNHMRMLSVFSTELRSPRIRLKSSETPFLATVV